MEIDSIKLRIPYHLRMIVGIRGEDSVVALNKKKVLEV